MKNKELDDLYIFAKRFEYEQKMIYKKYKKGKRYLKLLNKLKIGKFLAYDDSCWDNEINELLLGYLERVKFKRIKMIKNIDDDSYFYNKGFYFMYNRKQFKFVRVWGQGSYSYVERVK